MIHPIKTVSVIAISAIVAAVVTPFVPVGAAEPLASSSTTQPTTEPTTNPAVPALVGGPTIGAPRRAAETPGRGKTAPPPMVSPLPGSTAASDGVRPVDVQVGSGIGPSHGDRGPSHAVPTSEPALYNRSR